MFCNNCGKKYPREAKVCPYCGEKQSSLSEGNGFFDMFPDKSVAGSTANNFFDAAAKNENSNEEKLYLMSVADKQQRLIRSLQRGQKRIVIVFSAAIILLLIVLIISTAYMHGEMKKMMSGSLDNNGGQGNNEVREVIPTPNTQFNTRIEDGGERNNNNGNNMPSPSPDILYDPDGKDDANTRKTAPPSKKSSANTIADESGAENQ